jgi:hypothetical protein
MIGSVGLIQRSEGHGGMIFVEWIQRILRIVAVDQIHRIVRAVLFDWAEDVVCSLVSLGRTGFG